MSSLAASYEKLATGGLYRPPDLLAGHELLTRAGLVVVDGTDQIPAQTLLSLCGLPDDVAAERLIQLLLLAEPPLWLYAAVVDDEVRWENVPQADREALGQLLEDAARREALLLSVGRALDAAQLAEQGADGEEYVVTLCREHLISRDRPDLAAGVQRVSLGSDQLGYDVTSPDTAGRRHRLEVKTTARASVGRVEFFLSRNEATVGAKDPLWSLIVVRKNRDGSLELIGWCQALKVIAHLPRDMSPNGKWASVRLSIPMADFNTGLPLD
jgi:hypothetical protein